MPKYIYNGPVKEFDKLIAEHWKGETIAPSEYKARSNLAYQFKRGHNRNPRTNITLPGKIEIVD